MQDIERLIEALNEETRRFVESDFDEPTHLYLDRTKSGVWSVVFLCSEVDELDAEMTRWTTGEEAIHALALCQCGRAAEVAKEIASGFPPPDRRPPRFVPLP
jgi:hypothetical protein